LAIPAAVLVAELYLAWTHRATFAPMLRARPAQSAARPADHATTAPIRHAA
jgi:hypothetical protein